MRILGRARTGGKQPKEKKRKKNVQFYQEWQHTYNAYITLYMFHADKYLNCMINQHVAVGFMSIHGIKP